MKHLTLFLLSCALGASLVLWASGCTTIEGGTFENTTFNHAGWKSQAGIEGDASVDAQNDLKPKTSVTP